MSELFTYRVLRQMDGDRQYLAGDTRDMSETSAKHLVDLGVLEKVGKAKAEPAPFNKMEGAPQNKRGQKSANKTAQLGQDETTSDGLTRREVEADLTAMGVEFSSNDKLDDLAALREQARAARA